MTITIDWASVLIPLTTTFLLIDPMVGEPSSDLWHPPGADDLSVNARREAFWQRLVHVVPLEKSVGLHTHQHPYLVALEGPSDPLLQASWEMAQDERLDSQMDGLSGTGKSAHRIGGWLQSTQPAQDLTAFVSGLMRVNTEANTNARYLRLADRRVLAWLNVVLGDSALSKATGLITRWAFMDVVGQMACIDSTSEEPTVLTLTCAQWQSFMDGHPLHQIMAKFQGALDMDGATNEQPSRGLHSRASAALAYAQKVAGRWPAQFKTQQDSILWATMELLYPGRLVMPLTLAPTDTIETLSPAMLAVLREGTIT